MATIARLACTWSLPRWTVTPPCSLDDPLHRGAEHDALAEPAGDLQRQHWAPPTKRHIWAPLRVLKLRSKVPGCCSSPEAAM